MGGQPASDPSINLRSYKKDSDSRIEIKPTSFPHNTSAPSIQTLDVTGGGYALGLQNLARIGQVHPEQAIDPDVLLRVQVLLHVTLPKHSRNLLKRGQLSE